MKPTTLLLFMVMGCGLRADQTGTATGVPVNCPAGGLAGSCYLLTVTCPGVPDITATLKVISPSRTPIGTVTFIAGTGGQAFYEQGKYGTNIVQSVQGFGFTVVEITFSQANGWITGPAADGTRQLACRYATVAQWVYANIHQGNTSTPYCAAGSSGGSAAVAYGLSHYNLGSILSMVELTSGPPFGRIDYGCLCNQGSQLSPCGSDVTTCYNLFASGLVDSAYGNTDCSNHVAQDQDLWYQDSVASPDAVYSFPSTDVHVVFGGLDQSAVVPLGQDWCNLVTSKINVSCVLDAGHKIDGFLDGAAKMSSDIITYCVLQR